MHFSCLDCKIMFSIIFCFFCYMGLSTMRLFSLMYDITLWNKKIVTYSTSEILSKQSVALTEYTCTWKKKFHTILCGHQNMDRWPAESWYISLFGNTNLRGNTIWIFVMGLRSTPYHTIFVMGSIPYHICIAPTWDYDPTEGKQIPIMIKFQGFDAF